MEYKDTIFLPKTSFEMRANLPSKEPAIIEDWDKENIFKKLRDKSKGREKFVLHDGPPYANGHIHMGTALNKILKDVIVRTQQMAGKDSIYVPGWDCHGLPIEWKIEEEYRKKGKNKDDVPTVQFRNECREFAEKWIDIQKKEFRRLGVEGDWENPYLTMSNQAEAQIVRELGKFLLDESLYKGAKPVLWSVVEKTALADAEVEYEDHTSNTIYVKFLIKNSTDKELIDSNIVIWTTTPWTIPGNRALAYGKELDYSLIVAEELEEDSLVKKNDKLIFASELVESVIKEIGIKKFSTKKKFKGDNLSSCECEHPFKQLGYDFIVKPFHGDFVNLEQGTGVVHIAPGHGDDDYVLGIKNNVDIIQTVQDDGKYNQHAVGFEGAISVKESIIGSVFGGGILGGVALLWWFIRRIEGMGMGDIKLLLLIGAVLGPWPAIPFVLFVSAMLAVAFMIPIQLLQGGGMSKALPYGPFLAWASVLYILHGHAIMTLWLPGYEAIFLQI